MKTRPGNEDLSITKQGVTMNTFSKQAVKLKRIVLGLGLALSRGLIALHG